jgi:hypothetical protein
LKKDSIRRSLPEFKNPMVFLLEPNLAHLFLVKKLQWKDVVKMNTFAFQAEPKVKEK